ncbi:chemotaxis protein CheR, partial [Chitinispirillum alkaliphilum]
MGKRRFNDTQLIVLQHLIGLEMGLDFSREKMDFFEKKIISACDELGLGTDEFCFSDLLSKPLSKRKIEVLASHLTIGETHFFRDKKTIALLKDRLLPSIIHSKQVKGSKRIRIWSAGACTGEEPYTVAMLFLTLLPDWKEWEITILGTDINTQFLRKATEGIYSQWSFRETPTWVKKTFFNIISPESFEIHPDIKKLVTFSYLNLADDNYPSVLNNTNAMDLILCRNVLMYFSSEMRRQVIN